MGINCGFEAPFPPDLQVMTLHDLFGRESLDDEVLESARGVGDGRDPERPSSFPPGHGTWKSEAAAPTPPQLGP